MLLGLVLCEAFKPTRLRNNAQKPKSTLPISPKASGEERESESVDGRNPAPPARHARESARSMHRTPLPPNSMLAPIGWCRILSIATCGADLRADLSILNLGARGSHSGVLKVVQDFVHQPWGLGCFKHTEKALCQAV